MAERLLISGVSNSGKTTLIKGLPPEETFVLAVDEKPFPFSIPHTNVYAFSDMEGFINGEVYEDENGDQVETEGVMQKLEKFHEAYGKPPKYFVIDSVSRVFQTAYDNLNDRFPNDNFKVYSALDREIKRLREFLTMLQENGINVIIISHALYDEKTSKYSMVDSGKFSKAGGFLSIVDHSAFIELKGKKRVVHHKNPAFASRSLLPDLPEKQDYSDYNLLEHMEMITNSKQDVEKFKF